MTPASRRRVLMIAFHFPPLRGSSGIQRTLGFVRHLPKSGWDPLVLSADARAYESTSDDLLKDIPDDVVVRRAFALDTARHLSFHGRYPRRLALPDRWSTWRYHAVSVGMAMIRRHRPDVIWSTYPIATAHQIGAALARRSGLPWIADFRDPMAQDDYPTDPATWQAFSRIEQRAVHEASACVFTTPGCARLYRSRYPEVGGDRMIVIENGYDERAFGDAQGAPARPGAGSVRFVLLHSGIIYSSERDPTALFTALGSLKRDGRLDASRFLLRLRATADDAALQALAARHEVEDLVSIEPAIAYRDALKEMMEVDGLLILQARNCNEQIPAKLYEYLRAGKPVLALTDAAGDTAGTLRAAGLQSIAPLDDVAAITEAIPAFIARVLNGDEAIARSDVVAASSRAGRAEQLGALLDATATGGGEQTDRRIATVTRQAVQGSP